MKKHTFSDIVHAAEAVEKAKQDVQDAKHRVQRVKERMMKEIKKTESTSVEIGHAQGQMWIAKAILADANRRLVKAREEHLELAIEVEGRERLDFLYVHPDAIDFLVQSHQPPIYQVEADCFKPPSAAQQKFIRNFEKRCDCTIYFVIEQLFPFPKESDDVHPTTSYLFFDNDEVRNHCLHPSECDYLTESCFPALAGKNYTYAYVQSNVEPFWSITGIAVDLTASGGLQRCTYSECQAKHEEMVRLQEYIVSKYGVPFD